VPECKRSAAANLLLANEAVVPGRDRSRRARGEARGTRCLSRCVGLWACGAGKPNRAEREATPARQRQCPAVSQIEAWITGSTEPSGRAGGGPLGP